MELILKMELEVNQALNSFQIVSQNGSYIPTVANEK